MSKVSKSPPDNFEALSKISFVESTEFATHCRHFSGYKPCGRSEICSVDCKAFETVGARVLLVHLGALGAVVRSTSLLPAIRRKYPRAHITWVTDRPGDVLLRHHPLIDRILTTESRELIQLRALRFDIGLVIDKSVAAAGVLAMTEVDQLFGFRVDATTAAILPATPAADELWRIGLSDHFKFHVNRKPETQLMVEALELGPWRRDPYHLQLTDAEMSEAARRKIAWGPHLVGINTGCAATIPFKKLSVEGHVKLIGEILRRDPLARIVLLGGKEDSERNRQIAALANVIESPTESGLRDGMISMMACDVVVSGDSLGMHMALALNKTVIAWFGPTCAHEIDLYDRGASVITQAPCSPCWKRSCDRPVMCYDLVDFSKLASLTVEKSRRVDQLHP
jgi:heptosyltransferase-2